MAFCQRSKQKPRILTIAIHVSARASVADRLARMGRENAKMGRRSAIFVAPALMDVQGKSARGGRGDGKLQLRRRVLAGKRASMVSKLRPLGVADPSARLPKAFLGSPDRR
jgi:hypothetical protein